MLRFIEGFDTYDSADMHHNGWTGCTYMASLVAAPRQGKALAIRSIGRGMFVGTCLLPAEAAMGTLGLAVNLGAVANRLMVSLSHDTSEQFRITINGNGSVIVTHAGREIGKTGGCAFAGTRWHYFELMLSQSKIMVALDGRALLTVQRPTQRVLDRFALILPDNQPHPVSVDDMYFDDEPAIHGVLSVVPIDGSVVPYVPLVHGVSIDNKAHSLHPDRRTPWTFRDLAQLPIGCSVLISTKQPVHHYHSIVIQ